MYWTNFWHPIVRVQQIFLKKNPTEVCSPQLYASFGTNCVQIGQWFETESKRCKLPTSLRVFSKLFCCTWTVGCQKFVQYIRMEKGWYMFLRGVVHHLQNGLYFWDFHTIFHCLEICWSDGVEIIRSWKCSLESLHHGKHRQSKFQSSWNKHIGNDHHVKLCIGWLNGLNSFRCRFLGGVVGNGAKE